MKPEVMQVVSDARQILIHPESWINCFALSEDSDGEIWEPAELVTMDRLSLVGALELAAYKRKYPREVMDTVIAFLYPLCWKQILAPYPYPHEILEDLTEGGHFAYEELGYFNDQDGRTHAEVVGVLNTALAHGYAKTIPSLPTERQAMLDAFTGLMEENKRKGVTPP